MNDWQGETKNTRINGVVSLLTSLEQNDAEYLAGTKSREDWLAESRNIDDRLAVAGLRLAVRPWAK